MYHAAILKGQYCGHRKDTAVLQLRQDIDLLDCEMFRYLGRTYKTKKQFREEKEKSLAEINKLFGTNFKHLIID